MIFLGIDVGTQGVRAVAADETGRVISNAHREYAHFNVAEKARQEEGWREQKPEEWWDACQVVLDEVKKGVDLAGEKISTICVDGTSGTIIALDDKNNPIGNAIMYNDVRGKGGKALPKIKWLRDNGACAHRFVHQADYIVGKLCGEYGITDWSNALKSGYDVKKECWTEEAKELFGENIPKVVPVGSKIKELDDGTLIIAGASDGYMSAVATCAVKPGEWASIIGTTLILKGVSKNFVEDSTGCVYNHKHPEGYWMPGGASNVGGRCLNEWFGEDRFDELNKLVPVNTPTGKLEYPLMVAGERFPFLDKDFAGFGAHDDYVAVLEGIGLAEKLCFEKLGELGCEIGDVLYSTGGACKSLEWLKLRANILQKTIKVPEVTDAAIGGAMLGASAVKYSNLSEAVEHMGRFAKVVEPDAEKAHVYDEMYAQFKEKLREYL